MQKPKKSKKFDNAIFCDKVHYIKDTLSKINPDEQKYHIGKTYKAEGLFNRNGKWWQDTFFFDDEYKNFVFKD